MAKIIILCVDDQREVLDALERDLGAFVPLFAVEAAESVEEARRVVQDAVAKGNSIGLVLADHLMPGETGVDFLVELNRQPATVATRKVLITAHAGLEDTVKAVNEADLHHYIAKPWKREELHAVVRKQLTDYVVHNVEDVLPYMKVLDGVRLMQVARTRLSDR
ncbi:MAG TPA: response regulator [Tepidisphaeraceae bacterium]|nr:response regulator [Tepidisphaeraceae bacterium]